MLRRQLASSALLKRFSSSPVLRPHRLFASSAANFTFHAGDYYSTAAEDEQDKILEEEEFAALHEQDGDDFLPFVHRLAKKADAMDGELRRIRWELFERRQLLMDTAAATLSGRPARADHVVEKVIAAKRRDATEAGSEEAKRGGGADSSSSSSSSPGSKQVDEISTSNAQNHFEGGSKHGSGSGGKKRKGQLTNVDFLRYMSWEGVPSLSVQLLHRFFSPKTTAAAASSTAATNERSAASGKEVATLTDDLDYLRRVKAFHTLNYYSRMILTPKRHIGHGIYQVIWNCWISLQNALGAFIFNILKGIKEHGAAKGLAVGTAAGIGKAAQFLIYGWVVSPFIHISRGLCNSFYGPINFFTGAFFFEAISGRWMRCTVLDGQLLRYSLQREKRVLRTIGRSEFRRKKMAAEGKWSQRLASMGFSIDALKKKMNVASSSGRNGKNKHTNSRSGSDEQTPDPYLALGVRKTATQQQIKQQYKKLAMVFHPDIVGSQSGGVQTEDEKAKAHEKFEQISSAYQILSNPEKRKAYDMGGSQGLSMYDGKFGHFMSRTPEQMMQSIFGGEGFRRLLIGDLLRSHWCLRFEAQVSVSIHEFEELQCIRVRQLAMELAAIADVHAKKPSSGTYYKAAGRDHNDPLAAGSAGHHRPRVVHSSSLPDPFGAGNPSAGKFAARHQRRMPGGKSPVIGKELKESMLEELGERPVASAATTRVGRRAGGGKGTAAGAETSTTSPYVLVPGSNEHNCFSRDYEERCEKFVDRMAEACFGPELLSEVGEVYKVAAQRFLHITPFYAPKQLMTRKLASGIDHIWAAFLEKTQKMEKEEAAKRVISEYFNMEYDNVVSDLHVVLRFAAQMVLQDCTESEEVRKKRCYAVWYLGERMLAKGTRWNHGKRDDADMMAYIQQAATSSASTSKPPAF